MSKNAKIGMISGHSLYRFTLIKLRDIIGHYTIRRLKDEKVAQKFK
jgi:hypothetical protein